MPRTPDPRTHETHDLELIAAYAAGDATGTDLDMASALVAGCPACATLHRDLRLIAAAVPELPAPVRRRDFTLTEAQAEALRPSGWRRVLGRFSGPRFRFATPLGTGLATLGIAGILLGTLAGTPLGTGGATSGEASSAQPVAAPDRDAAYASVAPSAANQGTLTDAGAGKGTGVPKDATQPAPMDPPVRTLQLAGAAAVLAGVALVTLRWASRRPT